MSTELQRAIYFRGGSMDGRCAIVPQHDLYPLLRVPIYRDPFFAPVLFDDIFAPRRDEVEEYNLRRDALGQLCYVKRGSGIKLSGWEYDGVVDDA